MICPRGYRTYVLRCQVAKANSRTNQPVWPDFWVKRPDTLFIEDFVLVRYDKNSRYLVMLNQTFLFSIKNLAKFWWNIIKILCITKISYKTINLIYSFIRIFCWILHLSRKALCYITLGTLWPLGAEYQWKKSDTKKKKNDFWLMKNGFFLKF